jgi:anaerobic magnesium-protoporphyrin IX monomethyl ester cyclase
MAKVLLVKPFQTSVCVGNSPPLGILYLASNLRQTLGERISVEALDARIYSLRADEVAHAARDADIIGLSAENLEATVTKEIARLVKRLDPAKRVVVGGPYAHYRCEEILRECPDVDWAFDGESDRTFSEAVRRYLDGESFNGVLGMYYRRDGEIMRPPGTDTIKDLDALPFPAWDLVNFEAYSQAEGMNDWRKRRRYASLFTSRGCPYKCAYCHDIFGKRFRFRSAENVLQEIYLLVDRYGIEEFQIVDDIFNLHKPRLTAIFAALEQRYGAGKLGFVFPNGLRGDILTEDVVKTLRRGGTYALSLAIETVTPRLQTLIQKDLDIPKVKRFIDMCYREGILVRGFFMLGFPTESARELLSTVWFALRSHLTFASFFTVIPQPATPMYGLAQKANAEALGRVTQDYYDGQSWYELATGFPVRRLVSAAFFVFYLCAPMRLFRIATGIPLWNLKHLIRQAMSVIFLKRGFTSPGRERLRRFRPDLELPEPGAPDGRAPEARSLRWSGALLSAFRRVGGTPSAQSTASS